MFSVGDLARPYFPKDSPEVCWFCWVLHEVREGFFEDRSTPVRTDFPAKEREEAWEGSSIRVDCRAPTSF